MSTEYSFDRRSGNPDEFKNLYYGLENNIAAISAHLVVRSSLYLFDLFASKVGLKANAYKTKTFWNISALVLGR